MGGWFPRLAAMAFAASGFLAPTAAATPPQLYAGAAKVDITPRGGGLLPGEVVRDPLYVRVIYLKSGNECAILVGIDKGLVSNAVVDGARGRIKQCAKDNIVISATHTHSGGDLGPGNTAEAQKLLQDAIVKGAGDAAKGARKARMGFATTDVHLNVNRDAFDGRYWYQDTNLDGASDKTMAVLYFVGEDDLPISVLMNYGMHPIDFFLSGVISADFAGEASAYVERRYGGAVALFTQAASGDQNPRFSRPLGKLMGPRLNAFADDRLRAHTFWEKAAQDNRDNPGRRATETPRQMLGEDKWNAYVAEVGEIVTAMGAIMGEHAIEAMRDRSVRLDANPAIWSGVRSISCPGRDRIDTASREGRDPGYNDGAPVTMNLGLLRLGDVALFGINSEIYTEIVQHLKERSPLTDTAVIGLANGLANSGYIYSDNAAHHLTFQVVGSRLKPGCAEGKIVDAGLDLLEQSNK